MVSNKLKGKRITKSLTQKKMAVLLGMSEVSYCRKESGKREFTCSEIIKVTKILELTNQEVIEIFLT